MSKELLIDSQPIKMSVEESKTGKTVARGEFARCGTPTQNGRVYPKAIYEREVMKMTEAVERRRAFGELDHPADGKTKLTRASHIITSLKVEDDGRVVGEAEILDTPNGRTLKAILEAGAEVGVSSRGFGSTKPGADGASVVGEDFVLRSFDFVADPAMKSAYPQIFAEDVDYMQDFTFTAATLESEFPELVNELAEGIRSDVTDKAKNDAEEAVRVALESHTDSVRSELSERFERQLAESLVSTREDIGNSLREEYQNDPAVAGATGLLRQIASMVEDFKADTDEDAVKDALKAKDLEISGLQDHIAKVESLAKDAGYRLYIERQIASHPLSETIRSVMGDMAKIDSLDDVKSRLKQVMSDLSDVTKAEEDAVETAHAEEIEILTKENSSLEEKNTSLESRIDSIERKLKRAVEIGESMERRANEADKLAEEAELKAYRASSVVGLTNAHSLLSLIEDVEDRDAIDRIVSSQGSHKMSSKSLEEARTRLRRGSSNLEGDRLDESNSGVTPASSVMNGMSMDHWQTLAGIK